MSTPSDKQDFLPLTKLQENILNYFVKEQGYGSGVHRLFYRISSMYKGVVHPALDENGNHALDKAGEPYELNNDIPNIKNHAYELNGKTYRYLVRIVTRQGVPQLERRLLAPTKRAIADYLSRSATHQKNRLPRHKVAGGTKRPPVESISPYIPRVKRPLCEIFVDSGRMPVCLHKGKQISWFLVMVDGLTKFSMCRPVVTNTQLTGNQEKRPQSKQCLEHLIDFIEIVNKISNRNRILIPLSIQSDFGSEFRGAFKTGIDKLRDAHPGHFAQTITPASRSSMNAQAEIYIKNYRKRLYSIQEAYMNQAKLLTKGKKMPDGILVVPDWHTQSQKPKNYDWTLDCDEASRREQSSYHQTIKTTPELALSEQNGQTWEKVHARIVERGERVYKDVKHNKYLPGFSPAEDEKVGDFVRIREFKPGDKSVRWSGKSSKAARDNFSDEIYVIERVKVKANGARLFYLQNIDPQGKRAPKQGLTRVQILKINPETVLDSGRNVIQEYEYLNEPVADDDEEEDATPIPPPKPLSKEERVKKLLSFSGKDWTRLLKGKELEIDGDVVSIVEVEFRKGKKFAISGWAASYKDDSGNSYDISFADLLDEAKDADWFLDEFEAFRQQKFG